MEKLKVIRWHETGYFVINEIVILFCVFLYIVSILHQAHPYLFPNPSPHIGSHHLHLLFLCEDVLEESIVLKEASLDIEKHGDRGVCSVAL